MHITMNNYRLALIGFGNVNQGLSEILRDYAYFLAESFGVSFTVVGVSDLLKGSIYQPDGFQASDLLEAVQRDGNLDRLPAAQRGWDALTLIANSNADIVVEASYTDLQTGQPAISYVRAALETGKHVVTSNKGPVALCYAELAELARQKSVLFGVEGTVMSGTPAVHLGHEVLKSAIIRKVEGILNGTTNYILTNMELGVSYQDALAEAQKQGYAEADPTGDVEGFDTAGKVAILSQILFDRPISMEAVERTGISQLTLEDINQARKAGERWKLIGALEEKDGKLKAKVSPTRIPLSHPLAGVSGATNAITYDTKILGLVTLIGPGAGRQQTGYALLSDLLAIHKSQSIN
jgi:homoserine dehydrogenase